MTSKILFFASIFIAISASAGTFVQDLNDALIGMKSVYQAAYAPTEWKKKNFGYDLNEELAKAQAALAANPNPSVQDARGILSRFIESTRDYHTSIIFVSTESASLPFQVSVSQDRYFLVYIDRTKLSEDAFPFQIGDELVAFDDKPVKETMDKLLSQITINVESTDRMMAARNLTRRLGAYGMTVPQGPLNVSFKGKNDAQPRTIQMIWDYTREEITPRGTFGTDMIVGRPNSPSMFHPVMTAPRVAGEAGSATDNPFTVGGRKTFTPDLGAKIWESDSANEFYAYIYQTADRKLIGYLRLPSYVPDDAKKAVADFRAIIERFENVTDSMVIDQVNNPGGSVYYLYTLASMLTDRPLATPRHHMSIVQTDVEDAVKSIAKLKDVKSDDDAKKAIPDSDMDGYPVSYEIARFNLDFAQTIVSEWKAGRRLTKPYWIGGIDHINPSATHYTKPILLLVNHLDFSGGDFFPTIMQDNKRVTILGSRTAGAGGYILEVKIPNNVGVEEVSVTGSIAERVDGNPIENLGVTPDIPYELTPNDYQNNYVDYVKAIQSAIQKITP